jgi:hypothetical protein
MPHMAIGLAGGLALSPRVADLFAAGAWKGEAPGAVDVKRGRRVGEKPSRTDQERGEYQLSVLCHNIPPCANDARSTA